MDRINAILDMFFSFKAYVMLPIIIFIIALILRMGLKRSLLISLKLAVGFASVFIAFDFFVATIGPAVESISRVRGLDFPVLDVGWPPLAAITWASPVAPVSIPLILGMNLLLLALGLTRTIYIDIWNYWHFALIGALVDNLTGSFLLGLVAVLLLALYSFKLIEWTAPDVERETGLTGVSASPVSVNGLIPYAVVMDALFERIPGFRRLEYNPSKHEEGKSSLLGEPMIIGLLIGLLLSVAAGYDIKGILETGIHIAAVMFLLPVASGLIGEGMQPITVQLREKVEARFPERRNLVIALDTGILMKNRSIMVTGLILMPIALVISLILPGNRTLPLGDLPNLISVMALSVLLFQGNVLRAVIAGIPVVVTYLLIASEMAPLFTALAAESGALEETGMEITAFTDGGNQFRYLLYELFQGKLWSFIALALLLLSLFFTWKRYKRTAAELTA
jgi:galactitol PTS system EIIC component